MIRVIPLHPLTHLLCVTGFVLGFGASTDTLSAQQQTPTQQVPAKLTCGSHSAKPTQLKAFQIDLLFDVFGSLWTVDRKTSPETGTEKFRGILSPSGAMLVAGQGNTDAGASWTYEFSGKKNFSGLTLLRGSLLSTEPKGTRTCSLSF